MIRFLSHNELCWKFSNLSTANILSSKKNKKLGNVSTFAQERALSALDLGLGIKQRGYNIFVVYVGS